MNLRFSLHRTLIVSAALTAAVALGGCQTDGVDQAKAMKELSPKLVADIQAKGMSKESPILVRLFKQEAELEVWKQDSTGRFALLKTYPICRWSGELGPKIKEGDRQAPEGFYTITPGQMNPKSAYYLSFNMGYPNAYDRAWGRSGSELMIHGDCSSRGCYAMTDEQIGEIYALGREAFFGGQRSFQVQAYPFRMTAANFAKHRNNPNMSFWKMLKDGNDHFEVTGLEPKVDVCERQYVFDAQAPAGSSTPLRFDPRGKCPAYEIDPTIVAAVAEKKHRDEIQVAELIRSGVPAAPIRTGLDGGMNTAFLDKVHTPTSDAYTDARVYSTASVDRSTLGRNVLLPGERAALLNTPAPAAKPAPATSTVVAAPAPREAPQSKTQAPAQVTAATPGNNIGSLFGKLFSSEKPELRPAQPEAQTVAATPKAAPQPRPAQAAAIRPKPAAPAPEKPAQVATQPAAQPAQRATQTASVVAPAPQAPATAGLMNGATPIVATNTFESRWLSTIGK